MIEQLLAYQSDGPEEVEFLGFDRVPMNVPVRGRGPLREVENPAAWGLVPFERVRTVHVNYTLRGYVHMIVVRDIQRVVRAGDYYLVSRLRSTTIHVVADNEIEELRQLLDLAVHKHHACIVTSTERRVEFSLDLGGAASKYWTTQ